jgi:hypothetical protein
MAEIPPEQECAFCLPSPSLPLLFFFFVDFFIRRYTALDKRRMGEMEGYQRDVGALRRAVRQLEAQWALIGGVVADAALAQQAAAVQGQLAEIAVRLNMAPENVPVSSAGVGFEMDEDEDGEGTEPVHDWLPSRAAHVPPLVAGIRPGAGIGMGRNTLAGFNAAEYAGRELAEVAMTAGQPMPGDPDYYPSMAAAATGRRPAGGSASKNGAYRNVRSSGYGQAGAAAASSSSHRGAAGSSTLPRSPVVAGPRGGNASFASPGPIPMEVDSPAPVYGQSRRYGGEQQQQQQYQQQQGESPTTSGSSSGAENGAKSGSASRGPRRVPRSAPDAAPAFDESVARRAEMSTSFAASEAAQSADVSYGGPVSPGPESRTHAIRGQLAAIRDRIVEMDNRAARLGGMSP